MKDLKEASINHSKSRMSLRSRMILRCRNLKTPVLYKEDAEFVGFSDDSIVDRSYWPSSESSDTDTNCRSNSKNESKKRIGSDNVADCESTTQYIADYEYFNPGLNITQKSKKLPTFNFDLPKMSFYSRRSNASRVPPLNTSTLQSRLQTNKQEKKKNGAILKARTILNGFVSQQKYPDYQDLVVVIRDANLLDADVLILLKEASSCIPMLNADLRLFVEAIFSIKWTHRDPNVISEFQSLIVNLLSAHNCHTKYAINKLIENFLPDNEEPDWDNGIPRDEDTRKYICIHWVFNVLLEIIPMCYEILLQSLIDHYPYVKKPTHVHEVYTHNLLLILEYAPRFRTEILRLIVSKLVLLDVNMPREEIEKCESNEENEVFNMEINVIDNNKMKDPVAHTLDVCMDMLITYLITTCHDSQTGELIWDIAKSMYHDMLKIFDDIILPTYNIHHVQFLMFTLCNFKTAITEAFLNYLWKKVTTPTMAMIVRQSAAAYLASLVARGTFVPLDMLKGTLQQMASWIHSYISRQDGEEFVNADLRIHAAFYCVCQALFYIVAFRQKDLVSRRKNITFLQSLNMAKMVTCKLNPLRVIQPVVVQNFASVARTYQLAYCYSVMEHNSRNMLPTIYLDEKGAVVTSNNSLDSFFPFDPYVLKRSGNKIWPFYVNYQKPEVAVFTTHSQKENHDMEDDDFLYDNSEAPTQSTLSRFSYGASPGFKDIMH